MIRLKSPGRICLFGEHQDYLNYPIISMAISTEKINKMIGSCLKSGAFGGKINGSGFGGTMFALLPNNEQLIKKAIEQAGGEGYIIETSNGVEKY